MIPFTNTYVNLPDNFYAPATPEKVAAPTLIAFNHALAKDTLGFEMNSCSSDEIAAIFAGQKVPEGAQPVAIAYAGHQFGHFVPQLGDGRAILLGEVKSPSGKQYDIQLKGSGRTPFSRRGDGKSSLGPVIREYLVSEAMHYLGVPTTRALAAVATGETVYREDALPGGVFTRVAASHIRVGTFEYFSAKRDTDSIKKLADFAIDRHYPQIKDQDEVYLRFLEAVMEAQASLVAHWLSYGFIHGVMNTDNMSISGETLDFGPCAFIDNFANNRVFSSIDEGGRYAYNHQIHAAQWNLYRLADCLVPLVHDDEKTSIEIIEQLLKSRITIYRDKRLEAMRKKLGLFHQEKNDEALIDEWLQFLEDEDLDFTLSFRELAEAPESFSKSAKFEAFQQKWTARLKNQPEDPSEVVKLMNQVNPIYIPRNHQVERAIVGAIAGDYNVFENLNEVLKKPFEEQPKYREYEKAPEPQERITATFCGT